MKIGNKVIRTHWLLDKKYQISHTLFVVLIVVISCLAFGYIVFLETYSFALHRAIQELNLYNSPDTNVMLRYSVIAFTTILFIVIYVAVAWAFFYSHRVAGPAWKFKKVLQDIAGGKFGHKIVLRKGDYLKDLANGFNETLKQMDTRAKAQESIINEMQGELHHLISILGSQKPSEAVLQSLAKKLSDKLERLASVISNEKSS